MYYRPHSDPGGMGTYPHLPASPLGTTCLREPGDSHAPPIPDFPHRSFKQHVSDLCPPPPHTHTTMFIRHYILPQKQAGCDKRLFERWRTEHHERMWANGAGGLSAKPVHPFGGGVLPNGPLRMGLLQAADRRFSTIRQAGAHLECCHFLKAPLPPPSDTPPF